MVSPAEEVIKSERFIRQVLDFKTLQFRGKGYKSKLIWPTDVDAVLDFDGRFFVFIETKFGDAALPVGQELALKRLVNAVEDSGLEACLIVASHSQGPEERIAAGASKVVRFWKGHGWWYPDLPGITVREQIEILLNRSMDASLSQFECL
jgi:hypothetical protein